MTPKEKAREIFNKYIELTTSANNILNISRAKNCALIAINELIEHSYQVMKPFWQEVKQEIEKL